MVQGLVHKRKWVPQEGAPVGTVQVTGHQLLQIIGTRLWQVRTHGIGGQVVVVGTGRVLAVQVTQAPLCSLIRSPNR